MLETEDQTSLEQRLTDEILHMYQRVADHPDEEFHFFHGRDGAERFGYDPDLLDDAPAEAVASFAGVGNPHLRAELAPGETVLDLGSGAGLDGYVAGRSVGPTGRVIGIDVNPTMCEKARRNTAKSGAPVDCHVAPMENLPVADGVVDVVISNGVVNLSLRKRRVFEEMFRVLRPGGRMSMTDIVSAKQLKASIVNDPKLWAS